MVHVDCELLSVVREMVSVSVRSFHTVNLAAGHESHIVIVPVSEFPLILALTDFGFDHNRRQFVCRHDERNPGKHHSRMPVFLFYDKTLAFKR